MIWMAVTMIKLLMTRMMRMMSAAMPVNVGNRAAQRAPSVGAAVAARAWRSRKGEAFMKKHAIAADPSPLRRGGPADARDARPCGVAGTDAETRN